VDRQIHGAVDRGGAYQVVKGVFDTKPGSGYDDSADRYHFPARRNYLDVAHAVVGDWIVYREPQRNGGRRAYIGAARVTSVEPDAQQPDHAYAHTADYFPFDPPVPFAGGPNGSYWETQLRAVENPARVGQVLQGRSMRLISEEDFAAIISRGLGETFSIDNVARYGPGVTENQTHPLSGYSELPGEDFVRRIERSLTNRKIRDANFRRLVCQAYGHTCAVTGLHILDESGRSEVQAAHIWSVEQGGPDVVQNGIALSGTVHWLFDRHLISLTEDYRLVVARDRIPAELLSLFERQMARIRLPKDRNFWPNPKYVLRHLEAFRAAR